MAERTEELRRDIEATRDRMSTTLDEIGDRVSPGRVVHRRVDRAKSAASDLGSRIMGTPQRVGTSVQQRSSARADQVSGAASSAADSVKEAAASAAESVSGAATTAAHAVAEAPGNLEQRVESGTQGNPLAAGAVAFGVGLLVGSMAPPTRAERQVASQLEEPVLRPAQEGLSHLGQDVAHTAQEQAKQAATATGEAARDAATGLKDEAVDRAQDVTQQAGDAAAQVTDQARSNADRAVGEVKAAVQQP